MEGFIELDGEAVSTAAKLAYEYFKPEDEKLIAEHEVDILKAEAAEDYFRSELHREHYKMATDACSKKQTIKVMKKGILFDKEVEEEVIVWDDNEVLKYLNCLSPYWDSFCVFLVSIGKSNMRPKISGYIRSEPVLEKSKHFEKFFDLRGKVLLPISDYQRLKEWMKCE